jgi:hypothetical protein
MSSTNLPRDFRLSKALIKTRFKSLNVRQDVVEEKKSQMMNNLTKVAFCFDISLKLNL